MSAPSPFVRVGPREKRRQKTRATLYEAALAEFVRVGFGNASVAEIARTAGVSRPSFYFHFPSKEHVLLELQWRKELEVIDRLRPCNSLTEVLHTLPDALVDAFESIGDAELARDMTRVHARRPGDLPLDEQPFPLVHELAKHFERGAERGELRSGLQPGRAAFLCLTSVFGYLMAAEPQQDRRTDLRALSTLFLA
ncbi:MAG: TetR/AcrR family transcriptional regulator [Deltaproteobacteria bacterium]|nr:TetR/AcrR family transcriptional regulator [Deltaproteobacteria bacterium]